MVLPIQRGWLSAVLMVSADYGWIGGSIGRLLRWDGSQWEVVAAPTTDAIVDIEMSPSGRIWAITEAGLLLELGLESVQAVNQE
jgi:hypothetical protein